jgi:hypothetical protein
MKNSSATILKNRNINPIKIQTTWSNTQNLKASAFFVEKHLPKQASTAICRGT